MNPGDRASKCTGLMKPHSVVYERGGNFTIVHKCLKCGQKKSVKAAANDNKETLAARIKSGPLII